MCISISCTLPHLYLYVKMTKKDFDTTKSVTWSGSDRCLENNSRDRHARRSTNVTPLSIEVHKRLRKTARAPVGFVGLFGVRRRSGTGGTRDAVLVYMEAATNWAELHTLGWENSCGSHPQQHHRVWFKFVDLVTRIGSARLQCTEFEVFHHFYTEIGFEKYHFEKNGLNIFSLISCIKFRW